MIILTVTAFIQTAKFCLKFVLNIYARAKDKPLFLMWIHQLKRVMNNLQVFHFVAHFAYLFALDQQLVPFLSGRK